MTDDHRVVIYHPHVAEEKENMDSQFDEGGVDPFLVRSPQTFFLFEKYGRSKIDAVCSKFKASDQKFS